MRTILLSLLVPGLGLLAAGCKEQDTNLPFTIPVTPNPPLITGPTPVFFMVIDRPGAPVSVAMQYSTDGGVTFQNATAAAGSPSLVQLQGQPMGASGFFFWDPIRDLGPGIHRRVVLRLYGLGDGLSAPGDTTELVVDLSDRLDPAPPGGPALVRPVAAPLPDGSVWVAGGGLQGTQQSGGQRWDPVTETLAATPGLVVPRDQPGYALLAGGQVLSAGGLVGGNPSVAVETYRIDPVGGARSDVITPGLAVARVAPAVAGLPDGRGVVIGGDVGGGASTPQVELVQPAAVGGSVLPGFMDPLAARVGATATPLPDGRVFIAGGFLAGQPVLQTALLDPTGAALTAGPVLPSPRADHTAVRLPDGRVALVGGTGVAGSDANALATVLAYDPLTNGLVTLPAMKFPRRFPGAAASGGQLVVFGGSGPTNPQARQERFDLDLAQWFDVASPSALARPDAVAVTTGAGDALLVGGGAVPELYTPDASLTVESFDALPRAHAPRADHTATALQDGTVLLAGGTSGVASAVATSESFDIQTRSFTPRASMAAARAGHAATLVGGGVLVAGGRDGNGVLGSAELFDPNGNVWGPAGTLMVPRAGATLTPLGDGRFLLAGGVDATGQPVDQLEAWDPATRTFSGAGTIPGRALHDAAAVQGAVAVGPGLGATGVATGLAVVSPGQQPALTDLDAPRIAATVTELVSGVLLVAGGEDPLGLPRLDAAFVDASGGAPALLPGTRALQVARSRSRAARLTNLDVLLVGGLGARRSALDEAELYSFTGSSSPQNGLARRTIDPRMVKGRTRFQATRLLTGQVLITGGVDERGVVIPGAEVWSR